MSADSEYVALINHAIRLHVGISTFPTIWAVLSILLDTQDHKLEYVQFLQAEYNRYYEDKAREYMEKLEETAIEIQKHMHDSITDDFNSISDYSDNGLTPLQEQQDEQPEAVNAAERVIDYDASDIMTEYLPWSTETYDLDDSTEDIYDRNIKGLQDEICKDTLIKTEENKPYIDNIDAYDRDRAQINQSLSDRLGLGQNSLPGAQQVIVAIMHNDQVTEVQDHLRLPSLGENIDITGHNRRDSKISSIP